MSSSVARFRKHQNGFLLYPDRNPNRSLSPLLLFLQVRAYPEPDIDTIILIAQYGDARPNKWVGHLAKGEAKRQKTNF